MNKVEAKYRALKLCAYILKEAIESGKLTDMVDHDTIDEDAERITLEADDIRFSLQKRAERLEATQHRVAADATPQEPPRGEVWATDEALSTGV